MKIKINICYASIYKLRKNRQAHKKIDGWMDGWEGETDNQTKDNLPFSLETVKSTAHTHSY